MKKIKMTTSLYHAELGVLNVGQEFTLDKNLADSFLEKGIAILIEEIKVEVPKEKRSKKKEEVKKNES